MKCFHSTEKYEFWHLSHSYQLAIIRLFIEIKCIRINIPFGIDEKRNTCSDKPTNKYYFFSPNILKFYTHVFVYPSDDFESIMLNN